MPTLTRIAVAGALAFALAACNRDPRAKIFPSSPDLVVGEKHWPSATVVALYWPEVGECLPCEMPALRSLAQVSAENPDIQSVMVLPIGAENPANRLGIQWPGKVVALDMKAYSKQLGVTPRPRIEVWDREGRLLLMKAIPPNTVRAAALGDEVLWAKAKASPRRTQ